MQQIKIARMKTSQCHMRAAHLTGFSFIQSCPSTSMPFLRTFDCAFPIATCDSARNMKTKSNMAHSTPRRSAASLELEPVVGKLQQHRSPGWQSRALFGFVCLARHHEFRLHSNRWKHLSSPVWADHVFHDFYSVQNILRLTSSPVHHSVIGTPLFGPNNWDSAAWPQHYLGTKFGVSTVFFQDPSPANSKALSSTSSSSSGPCNGTAAGGLGREAGGRQRRDKPIRDEFAKGIFLHHVTNFPVTRPEFIISDHCLASRVRTTLRRSVTRDFVLIICFVVVTRLAPATLHESDPKRLHSTEEYRRSKAKSDTGRRNVGLNFRLEPGAIRKDPTQL